MPQAGLASRTLEGRKARQTRFAGLHAYSPGMRSMPMRINRIVYKIIHGLQQQKNYENHKKVLTNMIIYRMLYRMKVTAIIADDLVNDVKAYTQSSTVTEAITIALQDWIDIYNIKKLNKQIVQTPFFIKNAEKIREINRRNNDNT
jgi:hypothetical protein